MSEPSTEKKMVKALLMARERIVTCQNKHGDRIAHTVTLAYIDDILREVVERWKIDLKEFQEVRS